MWVASTKQYVKQRPMEKVFMVCHMVVGGGDGLMVRCILIHGNYMRAHLLLVLVLVLVALLLLHLVALTAIIGWCLPHGMEIPLLGSDGVGLQKVKSVNYDVNQ